jgi:solute carrier family 25 phosphate transporter 3
MSAFRTVAAEEGSGAFLEGFGPTFVGYSRQDMFKHGLYECFKDVYMNFAGKEAASKHKGLIWCASSGQQRSSPTSRFVRLR